jgi:ATP/maltotriose-dependent transcriptional regulator MalT
MDGPSAVRSLGEASATAVAGPALTPAGDRSATQIFGRDQEFRRLSAFLEVIPRGPCALLLEGEAGMGKTTIWRWALDRAAASGHRLLACRPAEAEARFSYAGLADLFDSLGGSDLPELPEPQRRALDMALLRTDDGGGIDPRAVAAAVLSSLRALATTSPVLIAIDDVQWLDPPSARILAFAIRRLRQERIGAALTLRTPYAGAPLGLDRLPPGTVLERVKLGPLTVGALHHMLRARLDADIPRSVLLRLYETSGGNPFFALEIAHHLAEQGIENGVVPIPKTLRELVAGRLARLPQHTRDVLLMVSALSQPTVALLRAATSDPERVDAAIERAARSGLVEIDEAGVRFSHPLLASIHYQSASTLERRDLHRKLAHVVADLEERGRHLALATSEPDESVARALDEAAARARSRGAPDAAANLFDEACRLTPSETPEARWKRMDDAAMCHYLAGDTERARALWEEIERCVPVGPQRAAALWRLVEFRHSNLSLQQQIEAAEQALKEAGDDPALQSAIHHTIALALTYRGDARRAQSHAQSALELAERQSDRTTLALACTAAATVRFFGGHGLSRDLFDRAVGLESATRDLPLENSPRLLRSVMLETAGEDPDLVRHDLTELRRQAQESGLDVSLPLLMFVMSDHECRSGNWELAGRYAVECIEAAAQSEQAYRAPLGLLAMALLDARRGRLDVAQAAAAEALITAEKIDLRYVEARIWAVLGFIELSRGNPAAAHDWLGRVVELEQTGGYDEPTIFRCDHDDIEALIAMGKAAEAAALVEGLERRGLALDRPWALAMAARCRGLLSAAEGDLAGAQVAVERGLLHHERLAERFELGRTLLVLGNVQRRRRQKQAARVSLQRAQDVFENLGAINWAARAADEIQRAGLHLTEREHLTPTEERVARLVAGGRTNREIAATMFISVKAVEANLTRVYAKLEVRSRTELALRIRSEM